MGAAMRARRGRARTGERIPCSPRRARRARRTDRAGAIRWGECRSGGPGSGGSSGPLGIITVLGAIIRRDPCRLTHSDRRSPRRATDDRSTAAVGPAGVEFTATGAVESPNRGRGTGWWGIHRVRGGQIPKPSTESGQVQPRPRDRLVGIRPGQAIGFRRTGGSGPDHNQSVLRVHSVLRGETAVAGAAEPTSGRRWPVRPFPCPGSTRIVDTMEMTRFSRRLK
jgi:hypothetical protein